ncbi:MAG TPA: hypothetical protein VFF04_07290 [Candidatus Babeliales bacterium]|nr:hypothetical protein [Candidatus Babeliales bacterium]
MNKKLLMVALLLLGGIATKVDAFFGWYPLHPYYYDNPYRYPYGYPYRPYYYSHHLHRHQLEADLNRETERANRAEHQLQKMKQAPKKNK